jgi:hypothetical protein
VPSTATAASTPSARPGCWAAVVRSRSPTHATYPPFPSSRAVTCAVRVDECVGFFHAADR